METLLDTVPVQKIGTKESREEEYQSDLEAEDEGAVSNSKDWQQHQNGIFMINRPQISIS